MLFNWTIPSELSRNLEKILFFLGQKIQKYKEDFLGFCLKTGESPAFSADSKQNTRNF